MFAEFSELITKLNEHKETIKSEPTQATANG